MMNSNLNKYLSDVFRNEVKEKTMLEIKQNKNNVSHFKDQKLNQFLVDGKYTLRLDEII